jgi:hypothetical protein
MIFLSFVNYSFASESHQEQKGARCLTPVVSREQSGAIGDIRGARASQSLASQIGVATRSPTAEQRVFPLNLQVLQESTNNPDDHDLRHFRRCAREGVLDLWTAGQYRETCYNLNGVMNLFSSCLLKSSLESATRSGSMSVIELK